MTISSITAPAPFSQTNDCGGTLAAGASCTISLSFAPAATGRATRMPAQYLKHAGAGVSRLRGLGLRTNGLTTAPRSLDFGAQAMSAPGAARTVTVTNNGTGTIALKGVTAPRYYSQTNDCGATLAPAASCTVSVRFAPTQLAPLPTSHSMRCSASPAASMAARCSCR